MNKHGVFLVDDEALIVEGLRTSIERGMPDFYCAGTALSGEDALDQILKTKPDVVISDIRMRDMDGLVLARILRQLLPFTKVILLSGFDDFQYAQAAIRTQVFDYLLKPVTDTLLYQVLQRAVSTIADQLQEKRRLAEITRHLDNGKPFLRHMLFSVLRSPSPSPSTPVLALFDMQPDERYLPVYIRFLESVELEESFDSDRQLVLFDQVQYILEDLDVGVIPFFERGAFVLLLRFGYDQDKLDSQSRAYAALEKVSSMIALNREGSFAIGVGPLADSFQSIYSAYERAKEASKYCFFFGSGSVISYNDIAFSTVGKHNDDWLQQMILAIRAGARETALDLLRDNLDSLHRQGDTISNIRHNCLQVYLMLWSEFGRECFDEVGQGKKLCDAVSRLFACSDIHSIGELLTSFVSQICEALGSRLLSRNQQIVQQIEDIIDQEYATATLEMISSMIHMSPAYTSNLFSSTRGITIRDSIIAKRIEQAKELLKQSNMKLYEIAAAVGYSDPKYFSQLFRKVTGQTPNQYRYG